MCHALALLAVYGLDLQVCGVLLNKVGGAAHGVWLTEALNAAWQQQRLQQQVQVLGCIPKVGRTRHWKPGCQSPMGSPQCLAGSLQNLQWAA